MGRNPVVLQLAAAGCTLVGGILVYLFDRQPDSIYFLPDGFSLAQYISPVFGAIGYNLPTYIHVYVFILLSAIVVSPSSFRIVLICIFWFMLDCLFEVGQSAFLAPWIANNIPVWFADVPFLENTSSYFLSGTFDILDLVSIALGTIAAYLTIIKSVNWNARQQGYFGRSGRLICCHKFVFVTTFMALGSISIIGSGGNGGSDYQDTPPPVDPQCNTVNSGGWVSVTWPVDCPIETEASSPHISGEAFISDSWYRCCSGSATDTGVTVTWQNQTTGVNGNASQFVRYCWFFILYVCEHTWSASIPLDMGENRIIITASDPSNDRGAATITITRVPETQPPFVTSTVPEDQASDIAPNQVIVANFSEELDPVTINSNTFILRDPLGTPVAGAVTYANQVATFTPDSELSYSTTYEALITSEVRDLSGNALSQYYVWQFTTGIEPDTIPPAITIVDPVDGSLCVPLDKRLSATFNEPMDTSTLDSSTFQLTDLSNNPVDGSVTNIDTTTRFTPDSNLMFNTGYQATINTGARDLAGNSLAADYSWMFSTVPEGTGSWTRMSTIDAPSGRANHTAIWSGSEMIIWGGGWNSMSNTGGRYNPVSDTWQATSTLDAPSPRVNHTAVWTGSEMIIWGGYYNETSPVWFNTGGSYIPMSDTWQAISSSDAPSPRRYHVAIWTGNEMIVWGGNDEVQTLNDGARYNPTTDTWQPMSTSGAPQQSYGYYDGVAFWTGSEMLLLNRVSASGGRYNPSTDTWRSISSIGAPTSSYQLEAIVWSGSEALVWGGNYFGAYNPVTDTWRQLPTTCSPSGRSDPTAVWTGSEMIIWGGEYGVTLLETGGYYHLVNDLWSFTSIVDAPLPRNRHTAVWTGDEMIIWGGIYGEDPGGKFTP